MDAERPLNQPGDSSVRVTREPHLESGSSEAAVDDVDGASVERRDFSDDRQSEPAPTGIPITGLVEPDEPVEDPVSLLIVDPAPSSSTRSTTSPSRSDRVESDRRVGMPSRIVGQVADQPPELFTVTRDPARRHTCDIDPQIGCASKTLRLLEHEVVEVDGLRPPLERAFIDLGEEQESSTSRWSLASSSNTISASSRVSVCSG